MLIVFMALTVVMSGCQANIPGPPTPKFKIELIQPKSVKNQKLVVVAGAEFVVTVRISDLDKELCPDVTFARFLRGNAMAGEFLARPRAINKNEFEYTTKVIAPKKPGDYKLIVAPSEVAEAIAGAPAKEKYPSLNVVVE